MPQITDIEITNACNLNCRFCAREEIEKHRGIGYMTFDQFAHIVSLYSDHLFNPRIFLHGEPLLHPKVLDFTLVLSNTAHVRSIGFTTNGTLLTKEMFVHLVSNGANHFEISFDGTDKDTYEFLRRGANFEQVKQNILDICETKTKYHWKVDIGINIIDNNLTTEKIPEFVDYWSKVKGLNRIDVSQLDDWAGTVNVDKLKHDFPQNDNLSICPSAWFTVVIMWNGWVVPCCNWLYKPMGNIFEQTLEEIWNGPKFIEFRKQMLKGRESHEYCKNCKFTPFNPTSAYFSKPTRFYPFTWKNIKNISKFVSYTRKKYEPSSHKERTVVIRDE